MSWNVLSISSCQSAFQWNCRTGLPGSPMAMSVDSFTGTMTATASRNLSRYMTTSLVASFQTRRKAIHWDHALDKGRVQLLGLAHRGSQQKDSDPEGKLKSRPHQSTPFPQ